MIFSGRTLADLPGKAANDGQRNIRRLISIAGWRLHRWRQAFAHVIILSAKNRSVALPFRFGISNLSPLLGWASLYFSFPSSQSHRGVAIASDSNAAISHTTQVLI